MSILSKVTEFVGGGLFREIKDTVQDYLPPKMSDKEKAELSMRLDEALENKRIEANKILNEAAQQLNERIEKQEGTAKDLREIPILGSVIIFARGCQRPVWGFFTMYLDYVWLTNGSSYNEQQQTALIVINMLVLGFLFGERTIKNLEPLIIKVFGKNNKN